MEEKITFTNIQGEALDGRIHIPKEPTTKAAIVCHGFSGSKDLIWLHKICDTLEEKGIAALRFDFSGHGESGGKFPDWTIGKGKEDVQVALELMKERGYKDFALVGHSAGGAVCLLSTPNHLEIKCLVSIASPAKADREENEEFLRQTYKRLGTPEGKLIGELPTLEILEIAEKIDIPTLIIHGTEDEVIPIGDAELIMDILHGEKHQEIIEGGDHVLLAETEKVVSLASNWILKYL
ncbi:MAG: alpha/beta hydrolase family protein [Candidatus Nanoarchaeia archaeon]